MVDNKRDQITNLSLKDFLTQDDVDAAVSVWTEGRAKTGKLMPTEEKIDAVKRLALDLYLPIFMKNRRLNNGPWELKGTPESKLYNEIVGSFDGRDVGGLVLAAKGVTNRLYEVGLKKWKNSSPNLVPGDTEITDPKRGVAGIKGAMDPQYWLGDNSHRKGLGYTQDSREED